MTSDVTLRRMTSPPDQKAHPQTSLPTQRPLRPTNATPFPVTSLTPDDVTWQAAAAASGAGRTAAPQTFTTGRRGCPFWTTAERAASGCTRVMAPGATRSAASCSDISCASSDVPRRDVSVLTSALEAARFLAAPLCLICGVRCRRRYGSVSLVVKVDLKRLKC